MFEHNLRRPGQVLAVIERLNLFHISALRQLQLHRMDMLRRAAVMAGDMATLETSVQHMAVLRMLCADRFQITGQLRVAASAVERTKVEVRQLAVKQMWDVRTNRVRIKQQCITKLSL